MEIRSLSPDPALNNSNRSVGRSIAFLQHYHRLNGAPKAIEAEGTNIMGKLVKQDDLKLIVRHVRKATTGLRLRLTIALVDNGFPFQNVEETLSRCEWTGSALFGPQQ